MSTKKHPARVALVGYGLGGATFHAPFIATTPGLELAAIVTRDPERAAAARARHPGAALVPDADALWSMADALDAVVVSTPNRTHVPLGLAALEAGLHVVVDKPLAPSAADARVLIDAAERRGLLLSVYHNRRWDSDFLTLRRLIAEGALGHVHRFESRFERWRVEPKPGWRQDPSPDEAGGILFDLGAHLVDQALVLFGPVAHVHAEVDVRRGGARVDDDAFVALTHESGVRSHLWMNVITALPAPRFRVLGSRATWTKTGMDVQEEQLKRGADVLAADFGVEPESQWGTLGDGSSARATPAERGSYAAFYSRLAAALRDGAPPPVDPRDALHTIEIIEAARAAASSAPSR